MTETPPFYDNLDLSLAEARRVMEAGADSRHAAAHCPVVATLDGDGVPTQRVMILRAVDWEARTLRFHTDARSCKVEELSERDAASVLLYEPDDKVQLRIEGRAWIETDSALTDAAWEESTDFARRCYLAQEAPGKVSEIPISGLPAAMEGVKPDSKDVAPARPNFAILMVEFDSVEWLYLANAGHRRARWDWESGAWQGAWLVP